MFIILLQISDFIITFAISCVCLISYELIIIKVRYWGDMVKIKFTLILICFYIDLKWLFIIDLIVPTILWQTRIIYFSWTIFMRRLCSVKHFLITFIVIVVAVVKIYSVFTVYRAISFLITKYLPWLRSTLFLFLIKWRNKWFFSCLKVIIFFF